jgi:hypothetical protein
MAKDGLLRAIGWDVLDGVKHEQFDSGKRLKSKPPRYLKVGSGKME